MGKRRFVAEVTHREFKGDRQAYQVVTVYPEEYNFKMVMDDIGSLTARKGILRTRNDKNWRYKDL